MSENPPLSPETPRGPSYEPVPGTTPAAGWNRRTAELQVDAAPADQPWAGARVHETWAPTPADQAWAPSPAPAGAAADAGVGGSVPPSVPQPAPAPTGYWAPLPPAAPGPERVGLGLLAAAGVVLACGALTAVIYHFGMIVSLTAWLMARGAAWAYTRVAGRPAWGRVPLLLLIVVGVFLGFLSMVGSAIWDYYWTEMGDLGTTGQAIGLVAENLLNLELWQELGRDAAMYFVFAALGAFGVLRRMARPAPDVAVN